MNCPKCGNLLEQGVKVCGICGVVIDSEVNEPVVEIIPNPSMEVNQPKVEVISNENVETTPVSSEEPVINIPSEEVKVENVSLTSETDNIPTIQDIQEPIVQQPIENTNQNVEINNQPLEKKSNDTLFYIIVGVLSFLIVAAVVYILFFSNK